MNDLINGILELSGGFLVILNCISLYKAKQVKGVNMYVQAFFAFWGFWNLYYYPSLNQWVSFVGGAMIAVANTVWVVMAIYYSRVSLSERTEK